MNQALLLRLHRWITLVFALPLLVVIVTGLVLSFQPIAQGAAVRPGSLTAERLVELVKLHDPDGKARGLSINARDGIMTLAGVGADGEIDVDLSTGAETDRETPLADLFSDSRRIHERLVFGMGWLVTASTFAMLALIALGVLMGLPRLRNTISGWHKGVAWFTLPLVIISPLTGLFLAFNFNPGAASAPAGAGAPPSANAQATPGTATPARAARAPTVPLTEAVRMVGATRDPSIIVSIGVRGGRMMARLMEGGEARAYGLSPQGMAPLARNWPRLIHEGNWMGLVSGGLNVITSLALLGLMGTGLTIWARRTFARRKRGALAAARAGAARAPTGAA